MAESTNSVQGGAVGVPLYPLYPGVSAPGMGDKKPDTSKKVVVSEKFIVTENSAPNGCVRTYDDVAMKEVLSAFFGKEGCELQLYKLTWDMLARVLAKEKRGIDLDPIQAKNLGETLAEANDNKAPVYLLNKEWLSMSCKDIWGSVFARFNVLPWNYTAYDDYKRFYQLGGQHDSKWSGKFPSKFSFNVPSKFDVELQKIMDLGVQKVEQPKQSLTPVDTTKKPDTVHHIPPRIRAAISKVTARTASPTELKVTFSADVQGLAGDISYSWDFGDGGTGRGVTAEHLYTKPGRYEVTMVAGDNKRKGTANTAVVVGEKKIIPGGIEIYTPYQQ